ncbi:hypothetical protein GCM10029964_058570 [Kibdelosporangium lantanae]
MGEQTARVNGVRICYETLGDPADRPLLLVMGLGGPLIWWDDQLCRMLVDRGFFVVRYDNRDCGRSEAMTGRASLVGSFLGARQPYSLADMAGDAAGLLDHLGIAAAHVTGVSMGGMIAQTLAIRHPDRVRSLVSVMSTTGRRLVGWPDPRVLRVLLAPGVRDRAGYVELALSSFRRLGSPGFPFDEQRMRVRSGDTWDRG